MLGELWCRTTFEAHTTLLGECSFCIGVVFNVELNLSLSCLRSLCTLLLTMLYWHRSQYVDEKGVFYRR